MKKLLLFAAFAVTSSLYGQISVGIHLGAPPPPRVIRVQPRSPGPGYMWVDGYWYANPGGRYVWHSGYWTRPPYQGASWMAPRYEGGQYYTGYWQTPQGRFDHDHKWDRDHGNRDYNRDRH